MPDRGLPRRTLRTAFWVGALFTLLFGLRGQATVSFGLALGALIGMFSLWSLTVAIPRLFDEQREASKVALAALLMLKLPLYAVVLAYAMTMPRVFHPLAIAGGVALVPAVLLLKVIGYRLSTPEDSAVGERSCRNTSDTSN
jgi:hypothetical protein